MPSTVVFSGHMKLVGEQYNQKLEDTESPQFKDLATKLEATVSLTPKEDDSLLLFFFFAPFHSSTLWSVRFFKQSITLESLLSLKISYGCCLASLKCFLLYEKKNEKKPLPVNRNCWRHISVGGIKRCTIPLVIPSTAHLLSLDTVEICL